METQLKTHWGNFELQRLPKASKNFLRAWDSADEYLLNAIKPNLEGRVIGLKVLEIMMKMRYRSRYFIVK